MTYTIQQVVKRTGIPATTLRYYDKTGLLPFLERKASGYRVFSEIDLASLQIVECLKNAGLSIEEIKRFSDWVQQGDSTLRQRYELFANQKLAVENQIEELKKSLEIIEHKMSYYKKAVEAGTEKHLLGRDKLPYADEFIRVEKL